MLIKNMKEAIGNTPLVCLEENLYAKVEGKNPTGSTKDRAALYMIEDAIAKGLLKAGGTIIEPTSGNTGIALCALAIQMGFKAIIVMPNNMSQERIKLMEALGATVILTPAELGMKGSIDMANDMHLEIPNSFIPDQFNNKANVTAHFKTTGPEIYNDLPDVDIFVAGIGTGGTITGIAKYLKMKNENVKVYGVEPFESQVINQNKAGAHGIQGIGANFIPSILDLDLIDEVIPVKTKDAIESAKKIMSTYGIFAGISSGAAFYEALELHKKYPDKKIVALFPDGCEKYMSTELFK